MTPEAQRIAIAKACGLNVEMKTICPYCKGNTPYEAGDDYGITLYEECRTCNNTGKVEPYCPNIPYYIDDLNAMYEAEKHLTHEQGREYYAILSVDICFSPVAAVRATAAQRAEAFLRTLNLWEE